MKTSHLRSASRSVPFAIALGLAAGTAGIANAAMDLFLQLSGVKGDTQDKTHPGESDVLQFIHGVAGNDCPRFTLTKYVDPTSPTIAFNANEKSAFSSARIIVRKAGITPIEYYTAQMTNVMVSSTKVFATGADDRALEEVVLLPASVSISYVGQNPSTGQPLPAIVSTYTCKGG